MRFGLRLRGDDADGVALATLVELSSLSMTARYHVYQLDDGSTGLFSDVIDTAVAVGLQQRGIAVVSDDDGVISVDDSPKTVSRSTTADGLLAAVPTRSTVERAPPAEALFVVHTDAAAATLLERLLLLGRDDAQVTEVIAGDTRHIAVRVRQPPWWLVSRAMDGAEPGVDVFAAASSPTASPTASTTTAAALFVEMGHRHPLSAILARALTRTDEVGLLWGSGRLLRTAGPWREHSILASIRPELPAVAERATVAPTDARFTVQLRLAAAGDDADEPELFVVDAAAIGRLQVFAESAGPDEIDRVVLGRLGDDAGRPRYVVRELVRASSPRLGARLQSLLQVPGYAQMVGVSGLFLPMGRRLVPALRAKALRELLGLDADDGAGPVAVIVDEDTDGLRVTALMQLDAWPLSQLTTFALTDRRIVYDRLIEDAVLAFPGVRLQRPARLKPERAPRVRNPAPTPRPAVAARPTPGQNVVATVAEVEVDDDRAGLEAVEQRLHEEVLAHLDDGGRWARLTEVKQQLKRDDLLETASTALFLGEVVPLATVGRIGPGTDSLLDLATIEQPSHVQAVRLCALVLRHLQRGATTAAADFDDDVLHQAYRVVLHPGLPVPRRLQWVTLLAIARHLDDPIGLTRAKEAVLGALNTRGLSEALDLPRFVRTSLAMAGLDVAGVGDAGRTRSEQLVVLERTLQRLVPSPLEISDSTGALLKAIFAHGLARVGGPARAVLAAVDTEAPLHDAPVQVLLRLYSARASFVLTRSETVDDDAWRNEVSQLLATVVRPEDRRVAEWLVKRSAWLRHTDAIEPPMGLRPSLVGVVDACVTAVARGATVDVAAAIADARRVPGTYDFEVVAALERLLEAALQSGRDEVIAAAAREAIAAAPGVRILAHRARLLGACVRAAAIVADDALVDACLEQVTAIASDTNVPSVRDLLAAIRPALVALRRVGATASGKRFLSAFVSLIGTSDRETGPLAAALAQGYLQLGDADTASSLLQRAIEPVWLPNTPHIDRFEAGMAVLQALAHWPSDERFRLTAFFAERLSMFTDSFTTSRWFPTHQILIAERLVDTIVDDSTVRGDALQGWLDEDEARVRRRILQDWRSVVTV